MKRSLLFILSAFILVACSPPTIPDVHSKPDTTPPVINSVIPNPTTLYENHPVTLIVDATDLESEVVLTYDFDFDGLFDEPNGYSYSTTGEKVVSVKASSEGGYVVSTYNLTVSEVLLDLNITYSAYANSSTGEFTISYIVNNVSNVPIQLTQRTYSIWASSSNLLINATNDIPLGVFISHQGGRAYASILGGPFTDIPNYFYLWIYYNDGYGNASFEEIGNKGFTLY